MSIGAGPERSVEVAPGLGWPRRDHAHPGVGWPHVPRETVDWPADPGVVGPSPALSVDESESRPEAPAREPDEDAAAEGDGEPDPDPAGASSPTVDDVGSNNAAEPEAPESVIPKAAGPR